MSGHLIITVYASLHKETVLTEVYTHLAQTDQFVTHKKAYNIRIQHRRQVIKIDQLYSSPKQKQNDQIQNVW